MLDNGRTKEQVTANRIVIAGGCRPLYPGIPGDKKYGITTDDLFRLKEAPGKTLIVGGTRHALEAGGYLSSLDFDVTIMLRNELLVQGFDQDMIDRIQKQLEYHDVKFIKGACPLKIEESSTNAEKYIVTYEFEGLSKEQEFDTVLFAIGRYALTKGLKLEKIGIKVVLRIKYQDS